MFETTILFGDPSDSDTYAIHQFSFETETELSAFQTGISAATGWLEAKRFDGLYGGDNGDDEPTTCPKCGARTDLKEYSADLQAHSCLNKKCNYYFLVEFEKM